MPDSPTPRDVLLRRIERRAAQLRRRRLWTGSAVAVLALAVAVPLVAAAGGDRSAPTLHVGPRPPVPSPTTTVSPTTVSPTTVSPTTVLAAGPPATYLALDSGQGPARLVVVDTSSGRILRVLVPALPGGGVQPSVSLTGDRRIAYYEQGNGSCAGEIDKVDTTTGGRGVAVGQPAGSADSTPAVSPDGKVLAYSRYDCKGHTVLVLDRIGQVAQALTGYPDARPASPGAFSPDGTRLLVIEQSGPNGLPALHAISVPPAQGPDRALAAPSGCYFDNALFAPDGTSIVSDLWCGATVSLVRIDPGSGVVRATLVAAHTGMTPLLVGFDATGRHLLYGLAPAQAGLPNPATTWYSLSPEDTTRLTVASTITPVAW